MGGLVRAAVWVLVAGVATAISGCNMIEIMFASAQLKEMIPGQNIASGKLDCWLVIEFDEYPDNVDPSDVRVVFNSVALEQPAEFDWAFISRHDRVSDGSAFGSGYRPNSDTRPDTDPPLRQEIRVQFPLSAKLTIADPPTPLWLEAELFWGNKRQDSERRSIEHIYARQL